MMCSFQTFFEIIVPEFGQVHGVAGLPGSQRKRLGSHSMRCGYTCGCTPVSIAWHGLLWHALLCC